MAWTDRFDMRGVSRAVSAMMGHVDLWLLPAVLVIAWFYFPYCQTGPNLCIWRALFHRNCPGCGLTRGICFLVHGRVREAIAFNPLSIVAISLMSMNFANELRTIWRVECAHQKVGEHIIAGLRAAYRHREQRG